MPPSSEPLIFPVGHYLGRVYLSQGADLDHHRIRLGHRMERLPDDNDFGVWALLHGLGPEGDSSIRWTRSAVEFLLDGTDLTGANYIIEQLLHRELAVQVSQDSEDVIAFARNHRLRPMLYGTGNTPGELGAFGIGLPGNDPVLKLTLPEFELWQWSPHTNSLWDTMNLLSRAWLSVGLDDPRYTDPATRMTRDLQALHLIISHGAGYLDRATGVPSRLTGTAGAGRS